MKKIDEFIKDVRKDTKLNQNDFANKLGVSKTKFSKWENAKEEPTEKEIKKIGKVFKVDVTDYVSEPIKKETQKITEVKKEAKKEKEIKTETNNTLKNTAIIVVSVIAVFVGLAYALTFNKTKENPDALKFKKEYEAVNDQEREKDGKTIRSLSISADNPFVYKSAKEISKMMDKKATFIVYFGFADCPWCRSSLETIIKAAKDYDISTIYYVDIKDIRDEKEYNDKNELITTAEGTAAYKELLEKMDSVLDEYKISDNNDSTISLGEKRIYAPNMVLVNSGKAIEKIDPTELAVIDPYAKLTKSIEKKIYKNVECIFKCFNESNVCVKDTKC